MVALVVEAGAASIEEELEERKGSLGAARAASWAASLAASFFSYRGSTISLLIALSLFSLFDRSDFAILDLPLCVASFRCRMSTAILWVNP